MKPRDGWAQAVALGVTFPALLAAGYLLGKWVGHLLGLGDWTAVLGAAVGVLGAFVELFLWAAKRDGE